MDKDDIRDKVKMEKLFFEPVDFKSKKLQKDYESIRSCIETLDALSRSSHLSIYVIDYFKKNFLYMSPNHIFLNSASLAEVLEMGYLYYKKYVPKDEYKLLIDINRVGFDFFYNLPVEERLSYTISYDFNIITGQNKKIRVNHKLTPIRLNKLDQVWLAMCVVSISPRVEKDIITISKLNSNKKYTYNFISRKWVKDENISLTDKEKDILRLAAQGLSNSEIAGQLFCDVNTIKFHRKNIFSKLKVRNIVEALSYSRINKLY